MGFIFSLAIAAGMIYVFWLLLEYGVRAIEIVIDKVQTKVTKLPSNLNNVGVALAYLTWSAQIILVLCAVMSINMFLDDYFITLLKPIVVILQLGLIVCIFGFDAAFMEASKKALGRSIDAGYVYLFSSLIVLTGIIWLLGVDEIRFMGLIWQKSIGTVIFWIAILGKLWLLTVLGRKIDKLTEAK